MTITDGKDFEPINDWPTADFIRQYQASLQEQEAQIDEANLIYLYGIDHSYNNNNEIENWLAVFACEIENNLFSRRAQYVLGLQWIINAHIEAVLS